MLWGVEGGACKRSESSLVAPFPLAYSPRVASVYVCICAPISIDAECSMLTSRCFEDADDMRLRASPPQPLPSFPRLLDVAMHEANQREYPNLLWEFHTQSPESKNRYHLGERPIVELEFEHSSQLGRRTT